MRFEVNTFSIVGRCAHTGELGCAVASAVPAVGALCIYLRSRVGAVSTQAWVNPYLATRLLDELARGRDAQHALATVIDNDAGADVRQVGAIGMNGNGIAWTGADCTPWAGQRTGADFAVQGNMLSGSEVLDALVRGFEDSAEESLDSRLLGALEAAQSVGGDKRGRQSAALKVVGEESYPSVDLRVDDHPDPVAELRRIHTLAQRQLFPFVRGMPKAGEEACVPPSQVARMLLQSPPDRPGGGGSRKP